MSDPGNELSPVSMITEKLSSFHLTEDSKIVSALRSLDVRKYIFGRASSLLSFDTPQQKDELDLKSLSCETADCILYAVNVPHKAALDGGGGDADTGIPLVFENIKDAIQIVKSNKNARFKSFTSRTAAEHFSLQKTESLETTNCNITPSEDEDGLPSVKCQDLVKLRKAIESNNEHYFTEMVWENARHLVNYHGDTPTILHEGFRYNALHVAARSKTPGMCQLILDTLGDPKFFDRIYKCDPNIRKEKIHHLLDQYLNNPDKRLGETPLHFASKFGCVDTVKILLSHPYCIKEKRNKSGETAAQILCTRCPSESEELRKSMEDAFKGLMYVPILRAEDNVIPPCIEKPCTKVEIEQKFYSSNLTNVNSPNFSVKAFAGPMSPEAAHAFYKLWKNPSSTPQKQSYTVDEQKCIHKIRLTDTEKGLERAGRNIAQDLNAEWSEYWPALDAFINLASCNGLKMLEAHLNQIWKAQCPFVFNVSNKLPVNNQCVEPPSSFINPLSHYLNSFLKENRNKMEDIFYTPPSSPEPSPKLRQTPELFVNGSELSRLDIDMFLAIRDIEVDEKLYPCICQWKSLIYCKLRSLENPKSLTPLASIRIPRLQRREHRCMSPRNLFTK